MSDQNLPDPVVPAEDENVPEPPVPADLDLRDYGYMRLDVHRLLTSETWIEAAEQGRLGHILMCLWAESWHQVPAARLPDNDAVLARLAMCDGKTWKRYRERALAGWIKCSDGLFYHPVVAEKALEAWQNKRKQKQRTAAATEAREQKRRQRDGDRDANRDERRDETRNDERDGERNVHQRRGEERTGEETERKKDAAAAVPVAASEPPATKPRYVFAGKTIRLTLDDFEAWRKNYHAIPDLHAELQSIDDWLQSHPHPKWFHAVSGMLRTKHEKNLASRAEAKPEAPPGSNGASDWEAERKRNDDLVIDLAAKGIGLPELRRAHVEKGIADGRIGRDAAIALGYGELFPKAG